MRYTRVALAVAFVLGLTAAFWTQNASGDDKKAEIAKDKLIGVWEAVNKGVNKDELPKGSTVEFTKDGKLHIEVKDKEVIKIEGKYTIEGDSLKVALVIQGKEQTETLKVTKLTDTELVTKDDKNSVDEFKKVPPKK